jgi:DNA-binding NarL/FixJ family response regulator
VELIPAMRPQLGLDLARERHPDLVLLDLHLPDMPGEEVLQRLRGSAETSDIPVVILSGDVRPVLIRRLLAAGARAFLTSRWTSRSCSSCSTPSPPSGLQAGRFPAAADQRKHPASPPPDD